MTQSNLVDGYLALTRQALTPALALRERVQARLDAGLAALGESGAPSAAGPSAASGASGAAPAVGLELPGAAAPGAALTAVAAAPYAAHGKLGALLGGGLLALGFLGGYWARGVDAQPPPLPLRPALAAALQEPLPEQLAPDEPARLLDPPLRSPAASPAPRASTAPRSASASPPPGTTSAATRDELLLLQRTERAVRAGNSALALMLLAELEARYPRSELLEERRALELLAHCVAHASDALRRAERFLREHPRSVYAERIGALCQAEAPATTP